ncbi:MAG: STAS domain-containing protein [Planctomycetota bacterium]|nr:STAS domain-containing protein [Planctomycetota bacterium]MDA1248557.1 STAS domain-containing protein [Planctomycetota bacterium]
MSDLTTYRRDDPVFEQHRQDGILTLTLVEDPTESRYSSKQHEYNRLYKMLDEDDVKHLLLDLHRCRILDSVTIGMLVSLTTRCRNNGGESVLCGVSDDVNGMLARLMLLQPDSKRAMWQTCATREEAVTVLTAR